MQISKIIKNSNFVLFQCLILFILLIQKGYSQKQIPEIKPETPDFKIITSTETFIELEFTPVYSDNLDFTNSLSNSEKYGSPDVKYRSFPVFFPGKTRNTLQILDSKYEDIFSSGIKPVPNLKKSKDKDGLEPVYEKNSIIYNQNSFYPVNAFFISDVGELRNKYFGNLIIYPYQYNPVTNFVRKYTYIRVRIVFGESPSFNTKNLSKEERLFLVNTAINSDVAANWSTKEFNVQKDNQIVNSVLATGDFYKIEIKETGIYKLDKSFFQGTGINLSSVNPKTIKIYGNGGAELPFNNSIAAPVDLTENKILVIGEDDGQFNDDDYILFYGRNPNEWVYDAQNKTYFHKLNHFAKSNYYWITFGGVNGLRMDNVVSTGVQGIDPLTKFKDKFFEEPELNNLGSTGYLWLSQRIGINESFSFNKDLKGYIDGGDVNFRFRFGNGSFYPEIWRLEDLNSSFLINQTVYQLSGGFSHINLSYISDNPLGVHYTLTPGKRSINFKASLTSQAGNSPNVIGYYDYFEVLYDRTFTADNNVLKFTSPDTTGIMEFQVNNFNTADVKIFDVTNQEDVNLIIPVSYSNGTARFQSNISQGNPKDFFAIGGNNFKTPVSISAKIANQNIKGDFASGASFVIITPKEFLSAANRLKSQRERAGQNYIKTVVIEVEKVYNEFSCGQMDPVAIRNFLKYTFNNWQERPVYVLFFGDGSYDYKNVYNLYNNNVKNWIPPIERNSDYSDDVVSFCSDDYFAEITESYSQPDGICIPDFATGRLTANSPDEANNSVDKIISYEDPANFDKWRNIALYIADDGWTTTNTGGEEGSLHTDQCEDVAQIYSPQYLKKDKVYIVSYPTEITPQGRRKPTANTDIINKWNEGRLIINYTGHGSTDLWAHEHIFERQVSIPLINNKNKYPFMTIASCDLARWDDPFNLSAAEQLVVLKDKGAIGVIAAVRPVYSVPNATFNNKLYLNLFKNDTLNLPLRTGKAMFNVKQELFYENDMKFALLCDPTLRMGVPQYRTKIDSMNSTAGDSLFEMKSLQKVKISGSILRTDSTLWSDYNGSLDINVLDVDKFITVIDFTYSFNYKMLGGIIYTGKANVINGKWTVDFVVPKDISYNPGRGKIISYFKNNTSDGIGFSNNFIMNGIDTTAPPDSTGPDVKLYFDSRNFRSGDIVNQNPKLIADFSDEHGINLTGTIGHKIEAIINDDENNKIDLTSFYSSSSNYQNGTAEYQMQNLADGNYKIKVKAWDTYNNYNETEVDFIVRSASSLALENVYNYPNPMADKTNFVFEHNFNEPLTADIKIYTVSGRLIKELNKTNITDKFVSIEWDGKDSDGDGIANGTYIYKILIKTEDGSFSKSSIGKLAKLK